MKRRRLWLLNLVPLSNEGPRAFTLSPSLSLSLSLSLYLPHSLFPSIAIYLTCNSSCSLFSMFSFLFFLSISLFLPHSLSTVISTCVCLSVSLSHVSSKQQLLVLFSMSKNFYYLTLFCSFIQPLFFYTSCNTFHAASFSVSFSLSQIPFSISFSWTHAPFPSFCPNSFPSHLSSKKAFLNVLYALKILHLVLQIIISWRGLVEKRWKKLDVIFSQILLSLFSSVSVSQSGLWLLIHCSKFWDRFNKRSTSFYLPASSFRNIASTL